MLRPTPRDFATLGRTARLYVAVRLANAVVFGLAFAMVVSSLLVPSVDAGPDHSHWPSDKRTLTIVDRTGDPAWRQASQWAVARWNEAQTGYHLSWSAGSGPCRYEGNRISVCLAGPEQLVGFGPIRLDGRLEEKVDGHHKTDALILVCSACTLDDGRRRVVMTHEVGHALGLAHSPRRQSVMYHGGGSDRPDETDVELGRSNVAHRDR